MKMDLPKAILVIVMMIFAAGSLILYPLNPYDYDADVTVNGTTATVHMESTITSEYVICTAELISSDIRGILYYFDESYIDMIGLGSMESIYEELNGELGYYGHSMEMVNAEELRNILSDTSTATKYSIVFASGSMPDSIYCYQSDTFTVNLVSPWIAAGGSVIWMEDQPFGYYYSNQTDDPEDLEQPEEKSESVFGLRFDDIEEYGTERTEISRALSINQNEVLDRAVNKTSAYSGELFNLGYETENGYSVVLNRTGATGGLVVMGGSWMDIQATAHILASRLSDWTSGSINSPTYVSGEFRGDKDVEIDISSADCLYVYYGKMCPRYARCFEL